MDLVCAAAVVVYQEMPPDTRENAWLYTVTQRSVAVREWPVTHTISVSAVAAFQLISDGVTLATFAATQTAVCAHREDEVAHRSVRPARPCTVALRERDSATLCLAVPVVSSVINAPTDGSVAATVATPTAAVASVTCISSATRVIPGPATYISSWPTHQAYSAIKAA